MQGNAVNRKRVQWLMQAQRTCDYVLKVKN